jgi:hypothetical protein
VLSLSEPDAPIEEIAWMLAREFNGDPTVNIRDLVRRRNDDADGSVLARLDGELLGAMLCRERDGMAFVDVRVVSRHWRNSWPNLLMLERALGRAQALTLPRVRFFCDEGIRDTIKLARRGGGAEVDVKTRYHLAFD